MSAKRYDLYQSDNGFYFFYEPARKASTYLRLTITNAYENLTGPMLGNKPIYGTFIASCDSLEDLESTHPELFV